MNVATASFSTIQERHQSGGVRPAAHLSKHPGRHVLPRSAGDHPEAVPARQLADVRPRQPHDAHRRRVAARARPVRSRRLSAKAGSSSSRTSPSFDHNGDGRVDDGDLLFSVTLRSGKPDQALVIDDANNNHVALFVQDDWRIRPDLTLNLGLRYELDTDVKNISRVDEINPLVQPFLQGERKKDLNNFGPRIGFNWAPGSGRTSVHGGYGIYYDRVTLEIESLERGLDGRALPIEVRAGNVFFLDPATGQFPPFAPSTANPFTGFILTGRRRVGHQHHRQRAPESDGAAVQPRRSAGAAEGHRAARRRRPQPRHALHHRADHRRSVQPRGRRARSRREPRVQRAHALRRAARQRRSARVALSGSAPRTRWPRRRTTPTTIRFRSGADRSTRTILPASSDRRQTISATASRSPGGSRRRPGSWSRRC